MKTLLKISFPSWPRRRLEGRRQNAQPDSPEVPLWNKGRRVNLNPKGHFHRSWRSVGSWGILLKIPSTPIFAKQRSGTAVVVRPPAAKSTASPSSSSSRRTVPALFTPQRPGEAACETRLERNLSHPERLIKLSLRAIAFSGFWVTVLMFVVFAALSLAQSQGAATLFEKKCYSCHNIGSGNKKGPDLNGVTAQRSREWLHTFIPSPAAMNRRGDPAAVELFKKFAPETMPDQALSPEEIDGLLALIEGLSHKNQVFIPAGAKLSRPIAAGDVEAGLRLFTGKTLLNRGGTACFTCHDLQDVGLFGGGTLGPSLTAANIKYRDPELIAILQNPNFPTMNSLFATHPLTDEEIVQIFSLLQSVKQANPTAAVTPGPVDLKFPLLGIGFLVLGLAGINQAWKGRLRGVREALVNGESKPRAKSLDRSQP